MGGRINSDADGVLLREADKRAGVTAQVYGIALGYEDLNDHGELRCDAVPSLLVGKRDVTGEKRIRERDRFEQTFFADWFTLYPRHDLQLCQQEQVPS